jgi:outer membrane immunogenic protein
LKSARAFVVTSIVVLGVLAAGSPAASAEQDSPGDSPGPGRWAWSRCYAGPAIGTVPGRMAVDWTPDAGGFPEAAQRSRIRDNGSGRMDGPGFAFGGQVGCNRQVDRFVWGIEADAHRTNLDEARDTAVAVPGAAPGTETYHRAFGSDWAATARARAGWLLTPRVQLYATGGLAAADVDTENLVVIPGGGTNAVADARVCTGWTVGGGVEWTTTRPWSVRVGYLYADFGSFATTSRNTGAALATIAHEHRLSQHMVVAGLNVHF